MIRNLLLDIGNVLIMIDREAAVREFAVYNPVLPPEEFGPERVFQRPVQDSFEKGEISPHQFYEMFLDYSGCRLSYRHFTILWAKHFHPNEPMIRLGRELAGRIGVYLASNTDPLHIPPLFDRFPQMLFYRGSALSYELGALKPEREFYRHALEKLCLVPEECLFVDDNPDNVAAAEEFGIRSIQYRNFTETRALVRSALANSGIELEPVT